MGCSTLALKAARVLRLAGVAVMGIMPLTAEKIGSLRAPFGIDIDQYPGRAVPNERFEDGAANS